MATRTTRPRKSSFTAPRDPVEESAEPAPTRRRAASPRTTVLRRSAASSRTLRPVSPAEDPAAAVVPQQPSLPVTGPLSAEPDRPSAPTPEEPEPGQELVAARVQEPASALVPAPEPALELISGPAAKPLPEPVDQPQAVADPALAIDTEEPGNELPGMVDLQADVRALQGLVTERTEQTAQGLARTTLQMVRMVTGIAHHLDQLVEQVQQVSGVVQLLAQSIANIDSEVATLHRRTQDQLDLLSSGQSRLHEALEPILREVAGLRAQRARDATMERLDQFRAMVEIKQLRQAVEMSGLPPALARAVPRASRAVAKR